MTGISSSPHISLIAGAVFGLTGVIAGALGAHSLENQLSADLLDAYETATRFQMFHALLLVGLALLAKDRRDRWLYAAILTTILGTVLFSGSIYLLTLSELSVGIITPIGGVFLIAGWGLLLGYAIKGLGKGAQNPT